MQAMIALFRATGPRPRAQGRSRGTEGLSIVYVPWEQGYILVCSGLLQAPQDARSVGENEDAEGAPSLSD